MAQSKFNPTVHRRGRVFSEIQWSQPLCLR